MSDPHALSRRRFLGSSVAALAAADVALEAAAEETGSPTKVKNAPSTNSVKANSRGMPYGKIGNVKISRLIMGGNLVSGCMHSRDLVYVPQLARAYGTEEKIFETFKVCEENGINTLFENGGVFLQRYNKEYGGNMQFIAGFEVKPDQSEKKLKDTIKKLVDIGIPMTYVHGCGADILARAGKVGQIARAVELAKAHGIPVGVGGHTLHVPMECEKAGVPCDFYATTLHSDDYASAIPKELRQDYLMYDGGKGWYDNMWCMKPEETIAFMKTVRKPWIAFKVLAAGAFHPREGFSYAFQNGADFIAVGMFDFQVRQDCELVRAKVKRAKERPRPWCG